LIASQANAIIYRRWLSLRRSLPLETLENGKWKRRWQHKPITMICIISYFRFLASAVLTNQIERSSSRSAGNNLYSSNQLSVPKLLVTWAFWSHPTFGSYMHNLFYWGPHMGDFAVDVIPNKLFELFCCCKETFSLWKWNNMCVLFWFLALNASFFKEICYPFLCKPSPNDLHKSHWVNAYAKQRRRWWLSAAGSCVIVIWFDTNSGRDLLLAWRRHNKLQVSKRA